jgi:hypothetical protein
MQKSLHNPCSVEEYAAYETDGLFGCDCKPLRELALVTETDWDSIPIALKNKILKMNQVLIRKVHRGFTL